MIFFCFEIGALKCHSCIYYEVYERDGVKVSESGGDVGCWEGGNSIPTETCDKPEAGLNSYCFYDNVIFTHIFRGAGK